MSERLDLNLLPLFLAVAETGSISAAARRLELPKSSVSRGVTALEAALSVTLFHRSTRKLSLTAPGRALLERVRPIATSLRELSAGLPERTAEPSGDLRLTLPTDLASTILPAIAADFLARFPAVRLDVRPTNDIVDLVGEGFDVALRVSRRLQDSTLVARRLCPLELGLFASHDYLARRGAPRSASELEGHDVVSLKQLQSWPKPLPRGRGARVTTDDVLFAHRAVWAGLGVGILPTFVAQADVDAGRLARVLPQWSQSAGSLYFVYPPAEHLPAKVTAFRDFLVAALEARPLGGG